MSEWKSEWTCLWGQVIFQLLCFIYIFGIDFRFVTNICWWDMCRAGCLRFLSHFWFPLQGKPWIGINAMYIVSVFKVYYRSRQTWTREFFGMCNYESKYYLIIIFGIIITHALHQSDACTTSMSILHIRDLKFENFNNCKVVSFWI